MTSFFTIWEARGSEGGMLGVTVGAIFYLLFPHIIIEGTWSGVIRKIYTIRLGFLGALPGWDGLPVGGRAGARTGERGCQLVDEALSSPSSPEGRTSSG